MLRPAHTRTLRTTGLSAAVAALLLTTACAGTPRAGDSRSEEERERSVVAAAHLAAMPANAREHYMMIAGSDPDEAAKESKEAVTGDGQWSAARTAPGGVVSAGAYGSAFRQLTALAGVGGAWKDVTRRPYDSDDTRYRDYYSNSSAGGGHVSGRVTAIAADPSSSFVYAASADGGVWRSTTGRGGWVPIADGVPSQSGGALVLAGDGSLWYATGEANTGGTSFAGSGVYRLADPRTGAFAASDRVGGQELESTTIGRLRFGGGRVYAATNRGIWSHSATTSSGDWTFHYAPNPDYMPLVEDDAGKVLVPAGSRCTDDTTCGPTNAAYKNIVNDIAVDPRTPSHLVAALGWRSGDTYNGFYESDDAAKTWRKINPTGALPADDIGYVTFGWAADGSRLYAINQSPRLLNKTSGTVNSYLDGIYVSRSGSITGSWSKIADSQKLANSGSALKASVSGKGYGPGIQAWYNQFLQVDPKNPDHVYAGLEEVYETKNTGSTWTTPGPYWNFYFPCYDLDQAKNTCSLTTHSDQHAAAVGLVGGRPTFFAGNDGGIYSRPVDGSADSSGHATDWASMTRDGSMDGLQYYAVAWGKDTTSGKGGLVISGGLQDNGVSNLLGVQPNGTSSDTMGSNFGGDGGDSIADPRNGCRQAQEYTNLSMSVTENCALNKGATSAADATSYKVGPADPGARFIAPFDLDRANPDRWIAGGQNVWTQDKGWKIRSGSEWTKAFDLGSGHGATAVAMTKGVGYAGWCGSCNNSGFTRGIATNATATGGVGSWHQLDLPTLPNRYVGGIGIDPKDPAHAYVAMNGFSRRFTEGPGAGVGHVFETEDGGTTWSDISGNFPDVPTSTVKQTPAGGLVVGSDLGVLYRAPGQTSWQRLGTDFPATSVTDVELADDGNVYASTHGRGIWSIPLP
ncbi:MAG: glycosyl hydrolase [Marmoricola sp.]|nr:glycosyl hydrolase [Marmoricola sp.]